MKVIAKTLAKHSLQSRHATQAKLLFAHELFNF